MSRMENTIAACCILAACCAGCDQQEAIQVRATDPLPAASAPVIETGTEPGIFGWNIDDARHVVYVIDRSGSMVDTFDAVRREVVTSFGRLSSDHDFHIIFYSDERPDENPPQRLVRANDSNKLYAWRFVETVRAHGRGSPVPALERAFDVLAGADASRPGKVIHLISDGEFPDNAEILASIRRRNQAKDVTVNTYLCGNCPPVAVAVMKRIAEENGGQYGYVIGD
ncbi:MAG: VWA domain-containing protein [Phycisphaerae bacterium]|nr:VWA domain-containing protein [Phycisphaerae bacterium]